MAASITFYESFRETVADGTIDLDTHTFKVMLTTSAYTPNAGTHTVKADVTNEHANQGAPGYATGGAALASVTWGHSGATATFDAADVQWTATGGNMVARYAVIYDDTAASDDLVAYVLLDTTPADVTATTGNTFTIAWNASGIFTIT
jgi:hypothetical protein